MPFDVSEKLIREAEFALGRNFPDGLRARLKQNNGGEIEVSGYPGDDPFWTLHPVRDVSDRKRAIRSTNHVVHETEEARRALRSALPEGAVVVASNGTGDLLLLLPEHDQLHWFDPKTGGVGSVETEWG